MKKKKKKQEKRKKREEKEEKIIPPGDTHQITNPNDVQEILNRNGPPAKDRGYDTWCLEFDHKGACGHFQRKRFQCFRQHLVLKPGANLEVWRACEAAAAHGYSMDRLLELSDPDLEAWAQKAAMR